MIWRYAYILTLLLLTTSGNVLLSSENGIRGIVEQRAGNGAQRVVRNVIPEGRQANHLFKGLNRLADTPANRRLIEGLTNGRCLGNDPYGKTWFAKTLKDGRQIYAYARNGIVKGAGVNQNPIDIAKRCNLK